MSGPRRGERPDPFATVAGDMRRRCSLIALVLAGCALLWAPAGAAGQTPAPAPGTQPAPPVPPPAPDLVLSGRNVRMTRGGVVGIRIGCRTNAVAGEACIGSLTVRLASAIQVQVDPPGQRPQLRRISPFNFGVRDFTLGIGDAAQVRLRLNRRAQELLRDQERVRVDLIARYNSRAGADGSARRNVRLYFPKRPGR